MSLDTLTSMGRGVREKCVTVTVILKHQAMVIVRRWKDMKVTIYISLLILFLRLDALQNAKAVDLEALVTGVCPLILMGYVNIFAQNGTLVEMEIFTKPVMTVEDVQLQSIRTRTAL